MKFLRRSAVEQTVKTLRSVVGTALVDGRETDFVTAGDGEDVGGECVRQEP